MLQWRILVRCKLLSIKNKLNKMIDALKKLFGFGPKTDYADLVKQGAIILDVRSKGEYAAGHIKGSLNIPVGNLSNTLAKLKDKNQAIITCCASGMRSASAKSILKSNGYSQVYNGGGWSSLQNKIS
jgi:rhodanese-related sulfurtransferase